MGLLQWVAADGTTLALDGTEGVKVGRGVVGLDGPPMNRTIDPRVSSDGSVLVNERYGAREFTLPLVIDETLITPREVVRFFHQSGTLVSDTSRELRQIVYMTGLEGVWSAETGGINGLDWRKPVVSFTALDPMWYGELESTTDVFYDPTEWNADIPWNEAIPWNGGGSHTIAVDGDVDAFARVVVLAGADPVTEVTFGADGVSWVATGFDAGEALTVDSRPGRLGPYLGSSLLGIAERPRDWTLLTGGSVPFTLTPGDVSFTLGAVSDSTPSWWVWWEPRWLTS